jgi:hypothetical protein
VARHRIPKDSQKFTGLFYALLNGCDYLTKERHQELLEWCKEKSWQYGKRRRALDDFREFSDMFEFLDGSPDWLTNKRYEELTEWCRKRALPKKYREVGRPRAKGWDDNDRGLLFDYQFWVILCKARGWPKKEAKRLLADYFRGKGGDPKPDNPLACEQAALLKELCAAHKEGRTLSKEKLEALSRTVPASNKPLRFSVRRRRKDLFGRWRKTGDDPVAVNRALERARKEHRELARDLDAAETIEQLFAADDQCRRRSAEREMARAREQVALFEEFDAAHKEGRAPSKENLEALARTGFDIRRFYYDD